MHAPMRNIHSVHKSMPNCLSTVLKLSNPARQLFTYVHCTAQQGEHGMVAQKTILKSHATTL
jgi:hypothetical protein